MEVKALARNLRVSPQKVKLVVDQIKGLSPQEAIKILDFVPKKSAKIIKKVILSAIANAKNNFGVQEKSLAFKEIRIGKGATFKRYRPIARGRAHPILKRTSQLMVILEGEATKPKQPKATAENKVSNSPKEVNYGTKG